MQHNPFSTRFIQPGAIPYKCFDGGTVDELVQRFLNLPSQRGIIVGPHGSGKSTLIASFVSELSSANSVSSVHQLRFSTDRSAWRSLLASTRQWNRAAIVILDGYEQLGFGSRFLIERIARSRSISILATAHRPVRGFETIWRTSVSESSSQWVLEQLLHGTGPQISTNELMQSEAWTRSRAKHDQNLRESLFDMYDWWQISVARRSLP